MTTSVSTSLCYPAGLTLYPFQIETITRTLAFLSTNKAHGCYVANEQGLGKTVTALVTANTLPSSSTVIICPAIMRLVWEEEVYKWCKKHPQAIPSVLVIESAADIVGCTASHYQFIICSYALLINKKVVKFLTSTTYTLLIADEAHNAKNLKAKRTQALFALARACTYKLLMSGTPMCANVVDMFSPCHMLAPAKFPSYLAFADRYSYSTEISVPVFRNGHTQSIIVKKYYGLKNAPELSAFIRSNFYIRYKKEDVLKELPPKIFQRITLATSYSVKVREDLREKVLSERQAVYKAITLGIAPPVSQNYAEHRRMQGEAKVPAIIEFVSEKLDEDIPIVLFAYHKNVIAALAAGLKKYNPVVITGATDAATRKLNVTQFQSGDTLLFIGNYIAAGVGITLTRGWTVCIAELDWIPNNISQAVDRVHRITQVNQVLVYWFVVKDSIDEQMDELIIRRTKESTLVLDSPAEPITA